ncbi:cytochrome c [Rhodosalinus halophilus]|uniref:Cytochrome c n=1 Tax=Rhodosalinus halophilus TaxID=2259333 RepID=A0A365UDH5_9RHOB|nr:c-type cytochrome [Rhodosalinus halophilus]RBI86755.1 cytochrome c [Rhodosalinus halophilus]
MTRVAFTLAALVAATPLAAQDPEVGKALYRTHCAACHGMEGEGNGPMAAILTLLPTDLTALSAAKDGVFPTTDVVRRIDGRDPLVAHGSPMPVYGDFFEGGAMVAVKAPSGQPIMTTEPVADLVAWLRSVQD